MKRKIKIIMSNNLPFNNKYLVVYFHFVFTIFFTHFYTMAPFSTTVRIVLIERHNRFRFPQIKISRYLLLWDFSTIYNVDVIKITYYILRPLTSLSKKNIELELHNVDTE